MKEYKVVSITYSVAHDFNSIPLYGSCHVVIVHPMVQLVQWLIHQITSVFSAPLWLQFLEIS